MKKRKWRIEVGHRRHLIPFSMDQLFGMKYCCCCILFFLCVSRAVLFLAEKFASLFLIN